MKLRAIPALLLLLLAATQLLVFAQNARQPKGAAVMTKKAQALVDSLSKGAYADARKDFNAEMKAALAPEKLETIWKTLLTQAGPYKKQLSAQLSQGKEGNKVYNIVVVTTQFEHANVNVRVTFDSANNVAGLFFAAAPK